MYPSLHCLKSGVISDEKLSDTLFVADEDGVDAVLYDTGPVDENSPGMAKKTVFVEQVSLRKEQWEEEPLMI